MIARLKRLIARVTKVYTSWRLPLIATAALSLAIAIAATESDSKWLLAGSVLVAFISILILHGLDVARQDRLRAKAATRTEQGVVQTWTTELESRTVQRPEAPRVSIVVTAHNEGAHLIDCLGSIALQEWSDFECIVVDDLSTDNTLLDAAERYEKDKRFRFIANETNIGLAGSRNRGASVARGDWLALLDGDDFLYPDAISARVKRLASLADDRFIGGAYCGWHSVPESTVSKDSVGPEPSKRADVTWLDATYDTPFIASAPLIKKEAFLRLGGFDAGLRTAEDFEFWSRFLRHGWVVAWTPVTGIAYRQRRGSMYRQTPKDHASTTLSVYEYNRLPLDTQVEPTGPFLFSESAETYRAHLARIERLIVGFVAAMAADDEEATQEVLADLKESARPWMRWAMSSDIVENTAARVESYDSAGVDARTTVLTTKVKGYVDQLWSVKHDRVASRPTPEPDTLDPMGGWSELSTVRLQHGLPSRLEDRPVQLMPSAAYHCDEVGPVAKRLDSLGIPVRFVVIPKRLEAVRHELRKYPFEVHVVDPDTEDCKRISESGRALLTLNDWGDYSAFVEHANAVGIPTFGKVEGVQDFNDVDVHWRRDPYRLVTHVLCQGQNDFEATRGTRSIVGSSRLERVWLGPPTPEAKRRVLINLNFTYGVLTEAQDMWLDSAIQACKRARVEYVVSAHPAQRVPDSVYVTDRPMRYLLTRPSVLISRFSTVPFEAMARGVPFVYHNPHGEKVPMFKRPRGAFDVTTSTRDLTDALRAALQETDYRSRCEEFFRRQVSVEPGHESEYRTCEALMKSLDGSDGKSWSPEERRSLRSSD